MKISAILALVLCVSFASAEFLNWTDMPEGIPIPYVSQLIVPAGDPTDALTFYTDRALFETTYPGLTFEDFSGTIVPANSVVADTGPFDYLCNNSCFTPGDIVEGIAMDNLTTPGLDMVVLTPPFIGVDEVSVGPNTFSADAAIDFTLPVNAFGVDIVQPNGAQVLNIEIYGSGGSLGSTTATGGLPGVFWGVYSDSDLITRIETVDPTGGGELFTRCLFGEFTALERSTWGEIKTLF